MTQSTILSGFGREFQLDTHRARESRGLHVRQVRRKIDHAAAGRQVAMLLAVAIGEMRVRDAALQFQDLRGAGVHQRQVRNVEVRLHRRMPHVVQESRPCSARR